MLSRAGISPSPAQDACSSRARLNGPRNEGRPAVGPPIAIGAGGTYGYEFPINQRAALNWYHPHPHMHTGEQVALGLAGAFILRDPQEDALALPGGSYELPLVIRDAVLDSRGNLKYTPKGGGFLVTIPLVNGTLAPYFNVDTALYRFRVLGGVQCAGVPARPEQRQAVYGDR